MIKAFFVSKCMYVVDKHKNVPLYEPLKIYIPIFENFKTNSLEMLLPETFSFYLIRNNRNGSKKQRKSFLMSQNFKGGLV